jgi:hypothetical protein
MNWHHLIASEIFHVGFAGPVGSNASQLGTEPEALAESEKGLW